MSKSLYLLLTLAACGALLLPPAAAQAQADADALDAAADADAAPGGDTAADADTATDPAADTAADADLSDAADAADATTDADAFGGKIRNIRIRQHSFGAGYRVVVGVGDDNNNDVSSVEVQFQEPFAGPSPQENPLSLARTGTAYDATGQLALDADGTGGVADGAAYWLTFELTAPDGTTSTLALDSPAIAGEKLTGSPVLFDGTAYFLSTVDWSTDLDCTNCPVISLSHGGDVPTEPAPAPEQVQVFAEPLEADAAPWNAGFTSFATSATLQYDGLEFDGNALGLEYVVVGTMRDIDGRTIGAPTEEVVTVELDDDEEPEPTPTLVIDGTHSGSISVEADDYVLLTGTVTRKVHVRTGGTLVIQGGTIGKTLVLEGGTVVLDGATIGKDIEAEAGVIEVGDATVGRDLEIKGAVELLGGNSGILVLGGSLKGSTTHSVVIDGNIEVDDSVSLRAGDLTVAGSLSAVGDVDLRARGNGDGGLIINGSVSAEAGDITMRSDGDGGLVVNDTLTASGEIDLRTTGGGDLVLDGDLDGGDVDLRVKPSSRRIGNLTMLSGVVRTGTWRSRSAGNTLIYSDIGALGEVYLRTDDGDLIIDGVVDGGGVELDLRGSFGLRSRLAKIRGTVRSQGTAGIQAGDILISGVLDATSAVTLDAHASLTISGDVDSGGSINLNSANFSHGGLLGAGVSIYSNTTDNAVTVWGSSVVSGGDVTFDAGADLNVEGDLEAQGDVNLDSGLNTTVDGSVSAVGDVSVTSGDSTVVGGNVDSGGSINLNSASLALGGLLGAGVSIYSNTTDNAVTVWGSSVVSGGDVTFDAGADLNVEGDLEAQGDVNLDSGLNTTVDGSVSAVGDVSVTSGDSTVVGGNVSAGEGIVFDAGEGFDSGPGTAVDSGADIVIAPTALISLSGSWAWGGGEFVMAFITPFNINDQGAVFATVTGVLEIN